MDPPQPGGIRAVDTLPPTLAKQWQADPNFTVQVGKSTFTYDVPINSNPKKTSHKELLDPKVKAALNLAVDRKQIIDPHTAYQMTSIMEGVVQRGTGVAARIGRPVAGKTGTTDDYDDAWFAGSTPQLTTVVWVGGPQRYAMVPPRTRIRVTGATWPAQIWARYSSTVLGSRPVVDFPEPTADQAAGLLDVEVPNVVGMPEHAAQDILHSAALLNSVTLVPDDQYPPGTVLSEDPPASTTVPTNTTVHLTVVASADDPVVPDLLGLAPAAAQAEAVAARLVLHITTAPESTPVPDARRGVVWKQTPASATVLAPGASISVWVNPR